MNRKPSTLTKRRDASPTSPPRTVGFNLGTPPLSRRLRIAFEPQPEAAVSVIPVRRQALGFAPDNTSKTHAAGFNPLLPAYYRHWGINE